MKPWTKSKTNRFGSALVVLGSAIVALPELQELINQFPAEYQGYAALVVGIIVMILRHFTISSTSTNAKGREKEHAADDLLNYTGHIEAVLVSNGVPFSEIQSPEEIEDKNMRYLYAVWNAMNRVIRLKER